ncbi:hypothetical protein [Sphingobium sp. WCS2017Hpa-17]|uniref:hypothetical protein n=1 Tax=Sphingobium sp. WCS2017Hpa-17 TaxID=3073638 RepID=UPI00288AB3F6|nr:hypothetical protein [Sphingobium sp. WCS2017Hpa-17]
MASRKNTIDWPRIEIEYLAGEDSIREIADRHEISDTAIRKRAKAEGWERLVRTANRREPDRSPPPPPPSDPATPADSAKVADDARSLIGRMLDELDVVTSRRGELEDMIVEATDGDDDDARRDAMMKALSLPSRANTLKTLALALKTTNEASAPQGKKAAAQDRANAVGGGRRFGAMGAPQLKAVK